MYELYEVYIKDYLGEWGLYHITSYKRAMSLKEEIEGHPDIYGIRVIPAGEGVNNV